jgi:hypothetical protein
MAQNFAASHLKVLDERYFPTAKTNSIINKGIKLDFNGRNSVTIYNVQVVAESDYVRGGSNRFGQLVELGTGTQTFTLSQDKAWTYSIDRGNWADSMMVTEVGESTKRQVREVAVPTTDKYRLATLQAYAVANSQSQVTVVTNVNAYQTFLAANVYFTNALIENEKIHVFMTRTYYNLLRRDPEFKVASDGAYSDVKSGDVKEVDGITIHLVAVSYLPANTEFLFTADDVLVAPTKFDMIRTLTEVQGIDGWVVEGRRYYDAFIPTNRGKAVYAIMAA